jgi:hypothetical protein
VTPNPRVLVFAFVAAVTVGAAPALAQGGGVTRPSNGLFGSNTDTSSPQTLGVTMSLAASADSDTPADAPTAVSQLLGPQPTAHANLLVGIADYDWRGRSVQVRANGGSTLRHDRRSGDIRGLSHWGAAGVTARLPRRTSLVINQTATYSPSYLSYLYSLFLRTTATGAGAATPAAPDAPTSGFESFSDGTQVALESGEGAPVAPDFPVDDSESFAYSTQMTITHGITRRSRVWAIAESSRTDVQGTTSTQPELNWHGVTGLAAYGLGRNTTATGRYRYRAGNFVYGGGAATPGVSTEHGGEIGVTHTWPLSKTRRLTFDVGFGSSVVIPPALPEGASLPGPLEPGMLPDPGMSLDGDPGLEPEMPAEGPVEGVNYFGRAYPLVGQLGVSYLFGQSWQTSGMYHRRVDYVPGFTAPVSTDGFTARLDGLIARRVDALISGAYSSGRPALNRSGPTFDTYSGNARLRVALARSMAAYVEYVYYFYDFREYTELAPGMPKLFERHGLRVGMTLRVPALGR